MSDELKRRLQALEEELARVDYLDESEQAMLQEVGDDIRRALGQDAPDSDLLGRARLALNTFEVRHPALTDAVNRVAVLLAEMGL